MEDLFVTYKQALALKELGFDEPCFRYAHKKLNTVETIDNLKMIINWNGNDPFGNITSIPLKSQVFKWFRDEHHLFANIYEWTTGGFKDNIIPKDWKPECRWKIYKPVGITYSQKDKVLVHVSDNLYRDFYYYEEAESACIDNLISIIK